jgi:hypothetical protein
VPYAAPVGEPVLPPGSTPEDKASVRSAGGFASPPSDPPAASASGARGQEETNQVIDPPPTDDAQDDGVSGESWRARIATLFADSGNAAKIPAKRTAFDFGWQSYLQHGRREVNGPASFEAVEPELQAEWRSRDAKASENLPWEEAREAARSAWNLVQDALADGTSSHQTSG